jgi:hypothetical protein
MGDKLIFLTESNNNILSVAVLDHNNDFFLPSQYIDITTSAASKSNYNFTRYSNQVIRYGAPIQMSMHKI